MAMSWEDDGPAWVVELNGLPVPPTYNHARRIGVIGRVPRVYPTARLQAYWKSVDAWASVLEPQLKAVRKRVGSWLARHNLRVLRLHAALYLPLQEVVYKNGRLRRMDTENRLKDLYDSVAKLIAVDDSRFQVGQATKYCSAGLAAWVDVRLVPEGLRASDRARPGDPSASVCDRSSPSRPQATP